MLTSSQRCVIAAMVERHEGRSNHMYLDTKGYVTVGVGHLLPSAAAALALPFKEEGGALATPSAIVADYSRVLRQPRGRLAAWYRAHTRLTLDDDEIARLLDRHIDRFHQELEILYPSFADFPWEARQALFDLIFNVGATNLRTAWPGLNRAIARRDWVAAAAESRRAPPISAARNERTRALFLSAAERDIVEMKPGILE